MQRVRELSVQALNGTNNDSDRALLNAEVQELTEELDRIAKTTQFNGLSVLNGDLQNSYMQLGANSGEDSLVNSKLWMLKIWEEVYMLALILHQGSIQLLALTI